MRTFNFRARNIGEEKYLSYTMGEDCELDEDVLDYCQDNAPEELIEIIYEEDDDYDYLTYQITGKTSLEEYIAQEHDCESVLLILRNVAQEMISLKEQAIPLSYVLLNRGFIYVDAEKKTVQFLCLPIESKGALSVEFKSFVRQLLANMKYDVEEDLNYVGKLLTYINGDNFNLRGLIGLAEALMEEEGISFEEAGAIDADGVEVVSAEEEAPAENISDIMNSLQEEDDTPLPEIGDDEEDEEEEAEEPAKEEEELESILPAGMQVRGCQGDTSTCRGSTGTRASDGKAGSTRTGTSSRKTRGSPSCRADPVTGEARGGNKWWREAAVKDKQEGIRYQPDQGSDQGAGWRSSICKADSTANQEYPDIGRSGSFLRQATCG